MTQNVVGTFAGIVGFLIKEPTGHLLQVDDVKIPILFRDYTEAIASDTLCKFSGHLVQDLDFFAHLTSCVPVPERYNPQGDD